MAMDGSNYFPQEILENILPRLPAKSLLRLKFVCKQWKATISDPEFPETHLRRSNNNSSFRPLLEQVNKTAKIVRFDSGGGGGFRDLAAVDYPPAAKCAKSPALCHCDGLLLLRRRFTGHPNTLCLWNPSTGAHRRLSTGGHRLLRLRYPHLDFDTNTWKFGICYDPVAKDYKVVVGDAKRYAVFHCRTNSWSRTKGTNVSFCNNLFDLRSSNGVSFKGSIYWLLCTTGGEGHWCEIVRFDGRDEEFKKPWRVDSARVPNGYLISSREALYLFPYYSVQPETEREDENILVLKKVGDDEEAWAEIEVQLPLSFGSVVPLCWTQENQILFRVCWDKRHLLYDETKGSFSVVENRLDLRFSALVPYMENMFLV